MLSPAKKLSVINCNGFESKSPLRSDLNYPVTATLNLDEKGDVQKNEFEYKEQQRVLLEWIRNELHEIGILMDNTNNTKVLDIIFSTAEEAMQYYEHKYSSENIGVNFEFFLFSFIFSIQHYLHNGKIDIISITDQKLIIRLCEYSKKLGYKFEISDMKEFYLARYKFFKYDIKRLINSNYPQTKQYLPDLTYRIISFNQLLRNETDVLEADWDDDNQEYFSHLVDFTNIVIDMIDWIATKLNNYDMEMYDKLINLFIINTKKFDGIFAPYQGAPTSMSKDFEVRLIVLQTIVLKLLQYYPNKGKKIGDLLIDKFVEELKASGYSKLIDGDILLFVINRLNFINEEFDNYYSKEIPLNKLYALIYICPLKKISELAEYDIFYIENLFERLISPSQFMVDKMDKIVLESKQFHKD